MVVNKNQVLYHVGKKPIIYDCYYTPTLTPKPVVIFCHGYKGFKDWGAWHLVAEAFAKAGFFFVKFNFSHNGGTVAQPIDFPDLDAFANNNFSTELEDLDRVINFISTTEKYEVEILQENISLIGHSRGGGIVLIKAEENSNVKNVITWAGVSDFKVRFQENTPAFKQWCKVGITYVENARTKQQMPHYFQFYKDFEANEERFTLKRVVKALQTPYLIVHGSEDPTVSIKEAQALHGWNSKNTLEIVQNANHVFGATHPFNSTKLSEDLQKVVAVSITFLKQNI